MYPGLSSASLYQIQVSPPPQRAFIIHNEYIQSLDEMVDRTDTAATSSTTTKLLTTTNMNGLIDVGDYVRVDADEQWVKMTAIAADTTTGDGITIDTLRAAPDNTDPITFSDVPLIPAKYHDGIFLGACYLTAMILGGSHGKSIGGRFWSTRACHC